INAARGLVVDTQALADAIMAEQIYGAGLDTIEPEPVPADSPVLIMPEPYCNRVVLSPHVAGTTKSVFFSAYRNFWNNVKAVSNGQRPMNIVNEL
ncbi:MAG: hydroxyacid dehydrogenase, partial [Oscillospiraceae bacterium]|nr:hydroxyacid dehydrogenase [Oscillospiraceae bacterium]